MKVRPWAGCALPGASDFIDVGAVDLEQLDAHGLRALARYIGIAPVLPGNKSLSAEVIKRELIEHAMSA